MPSLFSGIKYCFGIILYSINESTKFTKRDHVNSLKSSTAFNPLYGLDKRNCWVWCKAFDFKILMNHIKYYLWGMHPWVGWRHWPILDNVLKIFERQHSAYCCIKRWIYLIGKKTRHSNSVKRGQSDKDVNSRSYSSLAKMHSQDAMCNCTLCTGSY